MCGSLILLDLVTTRLLIFGLGRVNVRDILREQELNAGKAAIAVSLEAEVAETAREATGLPLDAQATAWLAFVAAVAMAFL